MPDALVYGQENISAFKLEEVLKENSLRVKLIFDQALVKEWLSVRTFGYLFIPYNLKFDQQQLFSTLLWDRNPQATLILYDLDPRAVTDEAKVRLFGAEIICGERALPHLERILKKSGARKLLPKQDFKILVVEDLDSPRDIICSYIEALGYKNVSGVASAKDALQCLAKDDKNIDCIITDERMPQITGHELVSQIRDNKNTANLPVIVLTAHGTADCLEQCLKAGATGFLLKPPRKEHLVRELARAMRVVSGAEKARMVEPENLEQVMEVIHKRGTL